MLNRRIARPFVLKIQEVRLWRATAIHKVETFAREKPTLNAIAMIAANERGQRIQALALAARLPQFTTA